MAGVTGGERACGYIGGVGIGVAADATGCRVGTAVDDESATAAAQRTRHAGQLVNPCLSWCQDVVTIVATDEISNGAFHRIDHGNLGTGEGGLAGIRDQIGPNHWCTGGDQRHISIIRLLRIVAIGQLAHGDTRHRWVAIVAGVAGVERPGGHIDRVGIGVTTKAAGGGIRTTSDDKAITAAA